MPRNGSGGYSLPAGNPVVTGTTITSTWANTSLSDIATGLTTSLAYDGQTTPVANLPMGGFKLTGLGAATVRTDAASLLSVQNSQGQYLSTIAGTNTITAVASPTLTAYTAGQTFRFISSGLNSGATTLNVDGLGAKNVFLNGVACVGGEIVNGTLVTVTYDGTQFDLASTTAAVPSLANVAFLNVQQSFTKTQKAAVTALTTAVAGDYNAGQQFSVNVNGSTFTVANPSALTDATYVAIFITFTTSNTVAFGANYKNVAQYTPTATAGKTDFLLFRVNSTNLELITAATDTGKA